MHSLASAAYRAYRRDRYRNLKLETPYQWIRNKFGPSFPPNNVIRNVRIRFLGLWDTVAGYGLPTDEMTRGVHRWLFPLELPERRLSYNVDRACHALALDETRAALHPILLSGPDGEPAHASKDGMRYTKDERISQVWFAGVHSNVGGGYPDDALAYISLDWIMSEARACGLAFKTAEGTTDGGAISRVRAAGDKDGRLYDPRKGLGAYYRYGPRKISTLYRGYFSYERGEGTEIRDAEDGFAIERPKIHESVFRRIGSQAHAYAPVGVPGFYDVVKANGEIVTSDQFGFETGRSARMREEAQEHVWNEIWKRRILYFATVGATIWLVIFPLISSAQRQDEFFSRIQWVSNIIRFVGAFLPVFASTWVDGYARAPSSFLMLLLLLMGLMTLSSRIASRSQRLMSAIWRRTPAAPVGLPTGFIYRLRSSRLYIAFHEGLTRISAPAIFVTLFVYLGLSAASHLFFDIQDVAGETCVDHSSDPSVPPATHLNVGETRVITFQISDLCTATGAELEGNGARYYVRIDPASEWSKGAIPIPLGGFSTKPYEAASWYDRMYLALFLPLRRELFVEWFRIVLRVGRIGSEEHVLEPDPTDSLIEDSVKPIRGGQLYVYVNDAVIGLPGLYGALYRSNMGSATLTVKRTR